jgi:hypothetical protein
MRRYRLPAASASAQFTTRATRAIRKMDVAFIMIVFALFCFGIGEGSIGIGGGEWMWLSLKMTNNV